MQGKRDSKTSVTFKASSRPVSIILTLAALSVTINN